MKYLIYLLFIFTSLSNIYVQNNTLNELKNLEGIWIAEPYFSSFELTISSIKSKNAFNPNNPVGLRINTSELENNKLTIGYSVLHDHGIRPEVTRFLIKNGDTLFEQGNFQINIWKKNSSNSFITTEIFKCNSFLSWTFSPDTALILFKSPCNNEKALTISYKRIGKLIDSNYLYPNPLYFYTRSRTLTGSYILLDSLSNSVSTEFVIAPNGEATGYLPFDRKIFYFSTDIYCGESISEDFVIYGNKNEDPFANRKGFIYKRVNENTIQFHSFKWIIGDGAPTFKIGKVMYTLKKNNAH